MIGNYSFLINLFSVRNEQNNITSVTIDKTYKEIKEVVEQGFPVVCLEKSVYDGETVLLYHNFDSIGKSGSVYTVFIDTFRLTCTSEDDSPVYTDNPD